MKTCTKCGETKPNDEFSWNIPGVKMHSRCKPCRVEDRMQYYERNKEKELKYKWERQQRKRNEAREYVNSIKENSSCADCGYDDPEALTFDHVRGEKKKNISQMVIQGYSKEALDDEIGKTEIVCGNCHIKREKKRRGRFIGIE